MANFAQFGSIGTMRIKTVELRASKTSNKVQVVEPYTRNVLQEDTVDNVINFLLTRFPKLTRAQLLEYIQNGLELRGIWLPTDSSAISMTEPKSAVVVIPGR